MKNHDYHEGQRAVWENAVEPDRSGERDPSARTDPSESEGQSSSRVSVYVPPGIEGGFAGAFAWALALGVSLFLALPITQFLSEDQDAVTSLEAISMMDLPPPPGTNRSERT